MSLGESTTAGQRQAEPNGFLKYDCGQAPARTHKTGNIPGRSTAAAYKPNLKAFAAASVSQHQLQQGLGFRTAPPSSEQLPPHNEKEEMLDLVNKVQMFQIAVKKINNPRVFDMADTAASELNYEQKSR